ncbi:hypothetical protein K443DRAFT_362330 [Laccaria amethystina LaAM-08-1]|uniref:Uncharacterized protein n=1 Tax=Laccaria amethystina LaAM-08-1 TaxID=1095629 RepID=A0A0C9WJB0_9AGAR|nr:hypothetical protein K443DRAFT_362330 [Laccaria amethystina LaAM-08-1]
MLTTFHAHLVTRNLSVFPQRQIISSNLAYKQCDFTQSNCETIPTGGHRSLMTPRERDERSRPIRRLLLSFVHFGDVTEGSARLQTKNMLQHDGLQSITSKL